MTEKMRKIIKKIEKSHSDIKEICIGKKLETVVYSEEKWSIRDVLGHIATWDFEIIKSINAFLEGGSYVIRNLDDDEYDFNNAAVMEYRKISEDDLLAEWEKANSKLIEILSGISPDKLEKEFEYPWGEEMGNVLTLAEFMIEHKEEHKEEIKKVFQESEGN